eukprot:XP_012817710.2 PREDICTED: uncharacterized protein LOC100485864 [Xenopus tropicalis]
MQLKWASVGTKYKAETGEDFPPFFVFSRFVQQQAQMKNDPSFAFYSNRDQSPKPERPYRYHGKTSVSTHKTFVPTETSHSQTSSKEGSIESPDRQCPIHQKPHPLKRCKGFRGKPIGERMYFLRQNGICFKCCETTKHIARDCKISVKCSECGSEKHIAALHPDLPAPPAETVQARTDHGRELSDSSPPPVMSKCTEICGTGKSFRSCSKICLVTVFPSGQRERAVKMYAVLDEQSNRSLAKSDFFNIFNIKTTVAPYTLKTCAGVTETAGRRATNFIVESFDGKTQLPLPALIECDMLPDDKEEIPSPEVAYYHLHLRPIANLIPAIDPEASILLLLGRDILQAHKVHEKINGPFNAPYAQRLELGWVIVGEVCLGSTHQTNRVSTLRTSVLPNGRTTLLNPCQNRFTVKESFDNLTHFSDSSVCSQEDISFNPETDKLGTTVFQKSKNDDKQALSIEDQVFLQIMDKDTYQDDSHSWVAPLPFRTPRCKLPSNREQAMVRLASLRRTLHGKPGMKRDFTEFIKKMLDNDHAEIARPLEQGKEHWYLPMFGVYHPHKPDQIRVVFDSSAECEGVSLNNVLLSGPDLNNTLLGVLIRFRKEPIAFTADVQQMFYCFLVREDHRDYLRFLWYKDHDIDKEVVEYRMRVHVFGNSPSPAVAIYCMRKAALTSAEQFGQDAKHFVLRHFYVDDGLASASTPEIAIDILNNAKQMLAESNLRLHKIASNSTQVMNAFPANDRAKDLKDLCLGTDTLPLQKSLGLSWDLERDSFVFQVSSEEKPFTKRGVLSTVNSLYDPLGFVAPVTIKGKALVRELSSKKCDWDALLPREKLHEWLLWKESLQALEHIEIPRCYVSTPLSAVSRKELYVFSDASNTAIGAVAYLKTIDVCNKCSVGFVMGKSRLSPKPAHTIPRLELCAAVLTVELYELIRDEIDKDLDAVRFFTDSKTVLGYICNTSRRFFLYVANRVNRIRQVTHPDQWAYVPTEQNPADYASRPTKTIHLQNSIWFSGPPFLYHTDREELGNSAENYPLIEPEADPEIKPTVASFNTKASDTFLHSHVFERFSDWMSLCKTIARLIHVAKSFQKELSNIHCRGWKCFPEKVNSEEISQSKATIISSVQHEYFKKEYTCLSEHKALPKQSRLKKLSPFIDRNGLLRVGGRLSFVALTEQEKQPVIIPHDHHIAKLIVKHYHNKVAHQGRHITEGAIRAEGFWILGGKRLISAVIYKCVICRKLRGRLESQKMADLPEDRVTPEPPFTSVGIDIFGPWSVVTRRTRGGSADNKRWAVLFTCLSTRAVHIELIETMSASSFINSLRRFFSIRGPAKLLRSDRGTNFVGACKELDICIADSGVQDYLQNRRCTWIFNPPHSSHMGGAWERLIGVARRILDAMLLQDKYTRLTHETLSTFMAEVMAIMNARPLVPVSSDPDNPMVLTPAMLLTQKVNSLSAPFGKFETTGLHVKQWKQVQNLADTFWKRWKREYLSNLQSRRKWTQNRPNIQVGDVVLVKDSQESRNEWPVGLIINTLPSRDGRVRKVEVKIVKQGTAKMYTRPISDIVVLVSDNT